MNRLAAKGICFCLGLALGAGSHLEAQEEPEGSSEKLLIYPVLGILDGEAVGKIRQEIDGHLRAAPDIRTILLELDSPGTSNGDLAPAAEAARYLADLKGVRVIAWIARRDSTGNAVAGNASALLALAARDIAMTPGSRLGYLPDDPALEVPDGIDKAASEARSLFKEFALQRPGPIGKSLLAASMVSKFHPDIFKMNFARAPGSVDETRFLIQDEIEGLGAADRLRRQNPDVNYMPSGQRLTLDPRKAFECGFAVAVESTDIHEVLLRLKLAIGDENIIDPSRGGILKANQPDVQTVVDFLYHPVVRFLLLLAGVVGILVEFKMPGTLVPSTVSLLCLTVFFVSGLYQPTGGQATADLWEILLFTLGAVLIAVEILLLPGILFFGLCGAAACFTSIVLAMVPSSGTLLDYRNALTILVADALTSAILFLALVRILPKSSILGRSGLVMYSSLQGTPTTDSGLEAQARASALVGRKGITTTPLRPAGAAEFDGIRIDVIAEGDFVELGEQVQIIEQDGTRTLVRKA